MLQAQDLMILADQIKEVGLHNLSHDLMIFADQIKEIGLHDHGLIEQGKAPDNTQATFCNSYPESYQALICDMKDIPNLINPSSTYTMINHSSIYLMIIARYRLSVNR